MKLHDLLGVLSSTVREVELVFYDGNKEGKPHRTELLPTCEASKCGNMDVFMIHEVSPKNTRITLLSK